MASYAEDILGAAREASGPSLRDFETIRSFQSRPATKDAVSVSFYLLVILLLIRVFLFQNGMPIYLDPQVIEGSLYSLSDDIKQHCITTLINGMEVVVLEHRLQDTIKEMKTLSVAFNTLKNDLEHSLTQHLLPRQVGGRPCECPHSYFCSGGRN
jgi:hypothetical protein